jgi:hypothetical protein
MNHRLALDHVLGLVAGAPCGESLILRGSMAMLAWAGERARPPADLDFVVRPLAGVPVDRLSRYPFVEGLAAVQSSPEAVHGAGRNEMWSFEEFDTDGWSPHVPPEGLHWMTAEDLNDLQPPHLDVLDLLEDNPRCEDGLVFDPGDAIVDATWGYAYNSVEGDGGVRVSLPWRRGDEHGSVQLDFAYDERLPEPPVFAAVPRAAGGGPTVVWSAGPELSLVWKVQWMADDVVSEGRVAGKDLYDAVLLAELDRLKLPDRLRRMVSRAVPDPSVVRGWEVDWHARDDPRDWLDRLALALRVAGCGLR